MMGFAPVAWLTRRAMCRGIVTAGLAALLGACGNSEAEPVIDISGSLPRLALHMQRASDGAEVSGRDYRGRIALLYFGYTFCPDQCPATLLNLSTLAARLGPAADHIQTLFITVDPDRDTLDVLKQYVGSFALQIDGLRGTPDEIAALAKRYRVAYSVRKLSPSGDYEVSHSTGVYVFDARGEARFLFTDLDSTEADLTVFADKLRLLLGATKPTQGPIARQLWR